jgi:hypothetical protein
MFVISAFWIAAILFSAIMNSTISLVGRRTSIAIPKRRSLDLFSEPSYSSPGRFDVSNFLFFLSVAMLFLFEPTLIPKHVQRTRISLNSVIRCVPMKSFLFVAADDNVLIFVFRCGGNPRFSRTLELHGIGHVRCGTSRTIWCIPLYA